jgi:hypothetical protein
VDLEAADPFESIPQHTGCLPPPYQPVWTVMLLLDFYAAMQ